MQRWMGCCIDFGKEKSDFLCHWSGACVCRTIFGASNSRCRMIADAIRCRRNDEFWRIANEWGEEQCKQHVWCVDFDGSTWLHHAIDHFDSTRGDITIVEQILDWGAPLEVMNQKDGKPIARAIELKQIELFRLLVARGADLESPMTPGLRWTPLQYLSSGSRTLPGSFEEEALNICKSPGNAPMQDEAHEPASKRQKQSKDGGDGLPHADFGSFGKSIHKLWGEYTNTLRLRNRDLCAAVSS